VVPVNPVLVDLARGARAIVTVEDGIASGGVGSSIAALLAEKGVPAPVRSVGLPRAFLPHGQRRDILEAHGLAPAPLSRLLVEAAGARSIHVPRWRERAGRRRRECAVP
jgi:1-deoxy-D-xylulose-5-phosphate synthase